MTLEEARRHMERRELSVVRTVPDLDPEYGEITNVNDYYVFVRFAGSEIAHACEAADLTLLAAPVVTERRRAFRAGVRADAAEVGKSAAREGPASG